MPSPFVTRGSLLPWIDDSVQFYAHQADGLNWARNRRNFINGDAPGLGKASACSEPILTPDGWVAMAEISAGSYVIGADGNEIKVISVYPQGVQDIYKVTMSDGTWTRVTSDHLWEVNSPYRRQKKLPGKIKTTMELFVAGLKDRENNSKWFIPMVAPIEFAPIEQGCLDAYCVGVLLGDGSLSFSPQLHTDTEIVNSLILPSSVTFKSAFIGGCEKVSFSGLLPYTRELGIQGHKAETKFIPDCYKWGSIEDRISILQGLLDTDGNPVGSRGQKGTTIEYGTVSKQLSEDVKHVVQSLGGRVSIKEKIPTYSHNGETGLEGQLFYRMVLQLPFGITPFRLKRKLDKWVPRSKYQVTRAIVSIEFDGKEEAQCILVDDPRHLYVTRDFILTHNTLSTLTLFVTDIMYGFGDTMLVICPSSVKYNWRNEILKFTKGINYTVIEGTPKKRKAQYEQFESLDSPKILIINYETAANDLASILSFRWHMRVLDEAHYIKNKTAKRSKAAMSIPATRKLMLTGTPMLNRVAELWTLLHECDPVAFPRYHSFLNRHVIWGGYKNKAVVGVKNEAELRDKLSRYMLRRLKKDCLDLPAVSLINRPVTLLPQQKELYDKIMDDLLLEYPNGKIEDMTNALTKFLRAKMICGTTAAIDPDLGDHSAKLDACIEDDRGLIENDQKIVIFTQFRGVLECYVQRAEAEFKVPVYQLHGGVKIPDRQAVIDRWSKEPGAAIIACMIQVAGIGLNMVASSECAFLDKLYTPGLNHQAVDRLNRIGQTESVNVRQYIARGTLESRIEAILRGKEKLNDDLIDSNSSLGKLLAKAMRNAILQKEEEEN